MYAPPGPTGLGPGSTVSRSFSQEGAAFGPPNGPSGARPLSTITAPTADVLVVVDSTIPIEWTRPDQMVWNPGQKRPPLGGLLPGDDAFLAISADGRVHEIRRSLPDETLRALFETRAEKRPELRITGEQRR
ncbi:MAG: hypothetical protein EXS09_14755 [Gemmataceae bacterium]|nr:hypothetical protein [Gemmataceae bacterium]